MWKPLVCGIGAAILLTSAAIADFSATTVTDLNVRAGPGPEFEVIGVIGANTAVPVQGCMEGSKWCAVSHGGAQGWVYSDYLVADFTGTQVVLTDRSAEMAVPVATYSGPAAAVSGAVGGAIVGALLGGPIGAAIGGTAGAVAGATIDPSPEVHTFVTSNPIDPVYLEGEVVVGAMVPETVMIAPIPEYEYAYVYVNGVPVLVEPATRRIVYVFRS
jgi:SH3-like domain-containing protein